MLKKRPAIATAALAGLFFLSGCTSADVTSEGVELAPAVEQPEQTEQRVAPFSAGSVGPADPASIDWDLPDAPVSLVMESLGISMPVVAVGVEPSGSMEIPFSVRDAGWYKFGPAPNMSAGTTVIAAHVDMPGQGVGPFAALKDAQIGAEIVIVDETGAEHVYLVTTVERIPKAEVPLEQVFATTGPRLLKLVTCGGSFDFNAQSYSDNYIVTAEKVS